MVNMFTIPDSLMSSPFLPSGPPLRPCRRTTAATLALFWTSQLSRWPLSRWIQRCLLFHLAIASGTCCWGTRHFRMMTGSMKNTVYVLQYMRSCRGLFLEGSVCVCECASIHHTVLIIHTMQELLCPECCR